MTDKEVGATNNDNGLSCLVEDPSKIAARIPQFVYLRSTLALVRLDFLNKCYFQQKQLNTQILTEYLMSTYIKGNNLEVTDKITFIMSAFSN